MLFPKHLALVAGLLSPAFASNLTERADTWTIYAEDGSILESRGTSACVSGLHIVALGGGGTTKGDLGLFQSTANGVKAAVKHSQIHQIGYPSGADPQTSIAYGTKMLNEHIRTFSRRCKKSQIVVMGYSEGAAAVMDVLCGDVDTGKHDLPSRYKKHITASILYGDLTYTDNKPYNVGSCTSSPGVVPRVHPKKCRPFTRNMQSYCDEGDPQCCGDGQGDPSVHFSYPGKYDGDVAAYCKMRYHTRKGKKHHHHN